MLKKRAPELLYILREGTQATVTASQRSEIQALVGDELVETGLGEDSEPNSRGLALEDLIDAFSPYK